MGLEVSIHVHAGVENSDYDDLRFRARSVKDDMAALAKFFVPHLYVFGIAAYFSLARKQPKGIIKLLEVFVPLPLSTLLSGKVANINNVFSGSGGEQKWAHQRDSLSSSAITLSRE
jgi:hypothetical protein